MIPQRAQHHRKAYFFRSGVFVRQTLCNNPCPHAVCAHYRTVGYKVVQVKAYSRGRKT